MKKKPTGYLAVCQCKVVIGAIDLNRTERREAGKILGEWVANGCTLKPKFDSSWQTTCSPCICEAH